VRWSVASAAGRVRRPSPVFLELEIGMSPQAIDDVNDPVLAIAGLTIGQPAQSRPERAEGETHGVMCVVGRDAADEVG